MNFLSFSAAIETDNSDEITIITPAVKSEDATTSTTKNGASKSSASKSSAGKSKATKSSAGKSGAGKSGRSGRKTAADDGFFDEEEGITDV